jgi:hypothetical protein
MCEVSKGLNLPTGRCDSIAKVLVAKDRRSEACGADENTPIKSSFIERRKPKGEEGSEAG